MTLGLHPSPDADRTRRCIFTPVVASVVLTFTHAVGRCAASAATRVFRANAARMLSQLRVQARRRYQWRYDAPRHTLSSCATVAAAVKAAAVKEVLPSITLPGVTACALCTALRFCQRVHNVGNRAASVRLAWSKGFLPNLTSMQLFELVRAARALDATPLRRLACAAAADLLRNYYLGDESSEGCNEPPPTLPVGAAAALGGVEALVEVLALVARGAEMDAGGRYEAANDGHCQRTRSADGWLQAVEALDDSEWREAAARVRCLGLGSTLTLWDWSSGSLGSVQPSRD